MENITLIDNECVTVWYYPNKGMVHHKVHKYLYGKTLREALNAGTDAMAEHHGCKWLSDDRANNALPKEDMAWAEGEWFPRTTQAGWKYWALVEPENVIGQMNMDRIVERYAKTGLTVKLFTDPVEGMAWLEKQK